MTRRILSTVATGSSPARPTHSLYRQTPDDIRSSGCARRRRRLRDVLISESNRINLKYDRLTGTPSTHSHIVQLHKTQESNTANGNTYSPRKEYCQCPSHEFLAVISYLHFLATALSVQMSVHFTYYLAAVAAPSSWQQRCD